MPKCVGSRGSAPDPAGELTTLSRLPSRLGEGDTPSPIPTLLGAFGAQLLWPPMYGYAPAPDLQLPSQPQSVTTI